MAGGVWQIPLAEASITFNFLDAADQSQWEGIPQPTGGGPTNVATPANLLAVERPTLLTKWLITNMYLPFLSSFSNSPATADIDYTIYARLIKNGLTAWQGGTALSIPNGAAQTSDAGVISADLVNPVEVNRGDNLQLALGYVGPSHNQSLQGSLIAYFGPPPFPNPHGQHSPPGVGTITYEAIELPGRRRL